MAERAVVTDDDEAVDIDADIARWHNVVENRSVANLKSSLADLLPGNREAAHKILDKICLPLFFRMQEMNLRAHGGKPKLEFCTSEENETIDNMTERWTDSLSYLERDIKMLLPQDIREKMGNRILARLCGPMLVVIADLTDKELGRM